MKKKSLFLLNYAMLPLVLILGLALILLTRKMNMLSVFALLGGLLILWVLMQVGLTIGFVFLRKNIRTITPSFVITALTITLVLTQAVPYINPSLFLKVSAIGFLAYVIGTGYSYKELRITELARK